MTDSLTVENGTDRIALYGSLDLTRDKAGLALRLGYRRLRYGSQPLAFRALGSLDLRVGLALGGGRGPPRVLLCLLRLRLDDPHLEWRRTSPRC